MKRSELKVGDVVYLQIGKYHYGSHRATVLSTEKYARPYAGARSVHPSSKGTLVKVKVDAQPSQHGLGHAEREDYVPLSHLLGPYEETVAKIAAQEAAARERFAAQRAETERRRAEQDAEYAKTVQIAQYLKEAGYDSATAVAVNGRVDRITLSRDDVERLVFDMLTDAENAEATP